MKRLLLFLLLIPCTVYANVSEDLTSKSNIYINYQLVEDLNDNSYESYITINTNDTITIESVAKIKYVYIVYELKSVKGELITPRENIDVGKKGYLHEFININIPTNTVNLNYFDTAIISEIHVYSEGIIPSDVQIWEKYDKTDLMLFSTHSDDEVLFFGGIMPTYINKGKRTHVVYLTRHDIAKKPLPIRLHEVLDGLWTSGVRDYPTFGILPDEHSKIHEKTTKELNNIIKRVKDQVKKDGLSDKKIIDFYVKLIRKYKPKVVLGHDEYGEYGHGQHIYNTYILKQALTKAKNSKYKVDNTPAYNVPKVYLHMYDYKNSTIINLDKPLLNYNDRTAYQVTQEAFKKHVSQQQSKYPQWLNGEYNEYTKASDITTNNPMYWGLYYSSVGSDKNKNDLFENI